jgi:hypothetical protein
MSLIFDEQYGVPLRHRAVGVGGTVYMIYKFSLEKDPYQLYVIKKGENAVEAFERYDQLGLNYPTLKRAIRAANEINGTATPPMTIKDIIA